MEHSFTVEATSETDVRGVCNCGWATEWTNPRHAGELSAEHRDSENEPYVECSSSS